MSTYFKIKGYKFVTADLEKKRDQEVSVCFNAWSQILLSL
mgnify:CR=1 FL=1